MRVYLRTKFQVSSIILTSFRQGVNLPQPPPQNGPLKSPSRLGLISEAKLEIIPNRYVSNVGKVVIHTKIFKQELAFELFSFTVLFFGRFQKSNFV